MMTAEDTNITLVALVCKQTQNFSSHTLLISTNMGNLLGLFVSFVPFHSSVPAGVTDWRSLAAILEEES